jgi:putative ABC transport system permease protein
VETLRKECLYSAAIAPEFRGAKARVKFANNNTLTDVTGTTPEYFQIRSMSIEDGRLFTREEVERRARVAVLGSEVWETLFGKKSPIGKQIRINGQSFEVVGRLKTQGAMPFANKDDEIAIPISTAMRRLYGANQDEIRSMSVQAVSGDRMKDLEEEIYQIIGRAHKLKPGDPPDVRIHNQADLIESADEQSSFLTMLLAGVALVSLVVGGIGIMNIMLVSVTERTREIGIRKALGAKRKHVLYQFLIESVTLSLGGGLLGVIFGIGVSWWMALPQAEGGAGFPMLMTLPPILISFGFAGFVGVFFGIYPAVKASGLNPIEALRYE